MDKSGQECQENFKRVSRTKENIGQSIQQSVGLLAETFRWKTQQSFYFNSNMLPSPKGFHYQNCQVQNINTNNEIVSKNVNNTFNKLFFY